jgi:hypothetical protein
MKTVKERESWVRFYSNGMGKGTQFSIKGRMQPLWGKWSRVGYSFLSVVVRICTGQGVFQSLPNGRTVILSRCTFSAGMRQ